MPRFLAGLAVGVVALLALVQLMLPEFAEERVEGRLTEDGGRAEVSLSAFPSLRLLWDDGDRLEVRGSDLRFEPARGEQALGRLDGFDEVSMSVDGLRTASIDADRFELERDGRGAPYRMRVDGTMDPRETLRFLSRQAGGPLGGLAGDAAAGFLPGIAAADVPLELDAELASRGGRAEVLRANASVAGVPAGPLAELVLGAAVADL